jgi:hypothetical protein
VTLFVTHWEEYKFTLWIDFRDEPVTHDLRGLFTRLGNGFVEKNPA